MIEGVEFEPKSDDLPTSLRQTEKHNRKGEKVRLKPSLKLWPCFNASSSTLDLLLVNRDVVLG